MISSMGIKWSILVEEPTDDFKYFVMGCRRLAEVFPFANRGSGRACRDHGGRRCRSSIRTVWRYYVTPSMRMTVACRLVNLSARWRRSASESAMVGSGFPSFSIFSPCSCRRAQA
jgi:hypothetical protein